MAQGDPDPSSHSLSDHGFGALADHHHDGGIYDHDHDDEFEAIDQFNLSSVPFLSMGIDVGSSGTKIIFSRLQMRGAGVHRALMRHVKSRETLYMSPISPTPFSADHSIDEDKLWDIVARAFAAAALSPDDVETGALILTGAAAQRVNAERIATTMAHACGDLICAAAGHHMEAVLAAYGSGLVEASRAGMGRCLLNIDIGGGTTKLSIVEDGHIRQTAALLGGGRLIVINADQRIIRLEPAGVLFAQRAGFDLHCGDVIAPSQLVAIAQEMAGAIVQAVREPQAPELMPLYLTDPLSADELARVEGVRASGGVAEFIYGREKRDFWDLGLSLGRALNGFAALPWPLLEAGECIRATVFGASHFSVQLSGDTLFISSPSVLLPCRNLAVIQPDIDCAGALDEAVIGQAIAAHRRSFDLADAQARFALALRWRGEADYQRLLRLAHGMIKGLSDIIAAGGPLYIIIDGDVAHTLGALLKIELAVPSEVLVIDGIALRDFDYVDIGRIRLPSHSVPVSVKSLMFGAVQKKL